MSRMLALCPWCLEEWPSDMLDPICPMCMESDQLRAIQKLICHRIRETNREIEKDAPALYGFSLLAGCRKGYYDILVAVNRKLRRKQFRRI